MINNQELCIFNSKIYRLITLIGFGYSICLFVHILFFSKTFPISQHIPIKENYSFEILIPLLSITFIINTLSLIFNKKYQILNTIIIWTNNFLLTIILRLTDHVLGFGKYILCINIFIVLLIIFNINIR